MGDWVGVVSGARKAQNDLLLMLEIISFPVHGPPQNAAPS